MTSTSIFATPTAIFAQLAQKGGEPTITLQRVAPGDQDLGKLAKLYEERDEVVNQRRSAREGADRIRAVVSGKPTHGPWTELPAHVLQPVSDVSPVSSPTSCPSLVPT